jgi:outer membrane assembly lipoprotein YfiO
VARAFLSGQKRIVWGFLRLPAYAEGVDILQKVWERVPGTRLGELALKIKADYHYNNGDMDFAQDDYGQLVQQYPSGRFVQTSMMRGADAAEAAFPGIRYDDQPLAEATERYHQVQQTFPTFAEHENVADRLDGIRAQQADKDLYIARWYQKTKRAGAAEFYYRQIIKDYPETTAAGEARASLRAMGAEVDATTEGTQP